jgi:hypothetical protein
MSYKLLFIIGSIFTSFYVYDWIIDEIETYNKEIEEENSFS